MLDAPAHRVAEIVDGALYVSPRPPMLQALAKTRLSAGLGHAFCCGIAMCHEQGRTAVYLSEDKTCIVEHPPHGPITCTPLDACDSIAC